MLTTRVLPPDEYPRLHGTQLGLVSALIPLTATVIVVERDGAIVGAWCGFPAYHYHVEGLEIVPSERAHTSVARRLLVAMRDHVVQVGVPTVLTGADSDVVRDLLHHAGASPAPMVLYNWPIGA
jgi:hypothetical protein